VFRHKDTFAFNLSLTKDSTELSHVRKEESERERGSNKKKSKGKEETNNRRMEE
jgi:hypothetical protein